MSDSLHAALAQFRDSMLSAVARLEFSLRDQQQSTASWNAINQPNQPWAGNQTVPAWQIPTNMPNESVEHQFEELTNKMVFYFQRMDHLEQQLRSIREERSAQVYKSEPRAQSIGSMDEILIVEPTEQTRNVLVKHPKASPALSAAVAAANPPEIVEEEEDD
jgi:hypothetical protein